MEIDIISTSLKRNMENRSLIETDPSKRDDYLVRKNMMKTNMEQNRELQSLKEQMEEMKLLVNGLLKK